jgi:hypothetical protein
MPSSYPEIDPSSLRRTSIEERGGTVSVSSFVDPYDPGPEADRLLDTVPDLFSGADLRRAVNAVVGAARGGDAVLTMVGAHFVKCGLSRLLIDLMERGAVTSVALNGAAAIHDFEIAMWGVTSEDVEAGLADGSFGMCAETADLMNGAAVVGRRDGTGLGEAFGKAIVGACAPHADSSILARALELSVPATVHVALGTDIVHQHPSADGAAIGETSLTDFRILAEVVAGIGRGVVMNVGSAVVLPEVFLKALSMARNLGRALEPFTAVSLDMNEPYRAMVNVVLRPTARSGLGIALRGRHEFLFPLFWAAVRRGLDRGRGAAIAG